MSNFMDINLCKQCPLNTVKSITRKIKKEQEFCKFEYPILSLKLSDKATAVLNIILAEIPERDTKQIISNLFSTLSTDSFISTFFKSINLFPKTLCGKGNSYSNTIYCMQQHMQSVFSENNITLLMGSKAYKITNYIAKAENRKEIESSEEASSVDKMYIQYFNNKICATINTLSLGIIGRDIFNKELKEKHLKNFNEKFKRLEKYFENPQLLNKEEIKEEDSFVIEPEVNIIESIKELEYHIDYLLKDKNVNFAFDTETLIGDYLSPEWYRDNFNLASLSISYFNKDLNKQVSFAIPLKKGYSNNEVFSNEGIDKSKQLLYKLFTTPRKGLIIGHNILFDLNAIIRYFNLDASIFVKMKSNFIDTMVAAHLLDENRFSFGLESLAVSELGFKTWKNVIDLYNENPKDFSTFISLCIYNAKDSAATYLLYKKFSTQLLQKYPKTSELLIFLSKIFRNIIILENKGSKISDDAMNIISEYYDNLEKKSETFLYEFLEKHGILKESFNLRSNHDLIHFLKKIRVPLLSKTKKGNIKLDKKAIDKLKKSDKVSEDVKTFLDTLLIYKETQKMKSAFINNYVNFKDSKGFIHPSILFHGTVTGRVAAKNPNIQQIPREGPIKRLYIPRDKNRILIIADYNQAEVRTFAMISQEKFLLSSILEKKDPYIQLATKIYKKDYEEVTKDERQVTKVVLLANIYGLTKYGLSRILNIDIKEAEKILDDFYKEVPLLKQYQNDIMKEVIMNDEVVGGTYRIRRFPQLKLYSNNLRQKWAVAMKSVRAQAINAPIQSCTSDTALYNTSCLNEKIIEENLDAVLISVVHDSVMFDVHEKDALRVYELMLKYLPSMHPLFKKFLTEKFKGENIMTVNYDIEIKAGYNYGAYDEKENPAGMREVISINDKGFIFKGIK